MYDIDYDGSQITLHEEDVTEPSIHTQYILARWCYLMAEPYLSDIEYDRIEKKFKEWYPDDIHSKVPWSFDKCPEAILRRANKASLICNPVMGYMAESIYSINNWFELEQRLTSLNQRSRVSYKIDGWNTRVSYFNGHIVDVQTRGRSGNSLSIESCARLFPKTIPVMGRVAVTGEMSIPNDKWFAFKSITGNNDQRASVRTALARGDIDYLSFNAFKIFAEDSSAIDDDQYKTLEQWGFTHPYHMYIENYSQLLRAIKIMSFNNKGYNYLTDGLVIENSTFQYAIRLDAWEEHNLLSYVTGYEEGQGAYGTFLKVLCKPITVEGKTFSKISINNIATIVENDLRIGSPIAFNIRSAANVVLDVMATKDLQHRWSGRYDDYKQTV